MNAPPPHPWWVNAVVLPIVFLLVGAVIGFAATWVRDLLDARSTKQAFFRAIQRELHVLDGQLQGAIIYMEDVLKRVRESQFAPRIGVPLRTSVYSSQLGKLKDVSDAISMEIIEVYSDILSLQGIVELLNHYSAGAVAVEPSREMEPRQERLATDLHLKAVTRVESVCQLLLDRLRLLHPRVQALAAKLPE